MKNRGFTLVEVLAVISVLGVVMVLALPTLLNIFNKSKSKLTEFERKELIDSARTYVEELDMGAVSYIAPKTLTANGKTYEAGETLSTYDLRVYLIENKLEISVKDLVSQNYYGSETGCNYETNKDKCRIPETCTLVVWIDGEKVENDRYYVSSSYNADIQRGCE